MIRLDILLLLSVFFLPCSIAGLNPDQQIKENFFPFFVSYKSGRVQRFFGTETVPPSLDPATGVASKDVTIDPVTNVTARLYLPKSLQPHDPNSNSSSPKIKKLPILVFYHGGGFIVESAFTPAYHNFVNSLVANANVLAVSVNYRRPPEHLLPAAYDDCWAALKWAVSRVDPWLKHGDIRRVYIAGDSAGGNIVHNVAMRVGSEGLDLSGRRHLKKIEGIVLLNPYFWGPKPIRGETRDPGTRKYMESLWTVSNKPGVGLGDPRINPTVGREGKKRLKGLGCEKVLVCVAEKDALAARGRKYFKDLKESGWEGEAEMVESMGENHVFFLYKPRSATTLKLMKMMVGLINKN